MKKTVATLIALSVISLMPVSAMAYTENYVTQDLGARDGMILSGNRMPSLIIESSPDFEGFDMIGGASFSLILTNANWMYSGNGQFTDGVYYSKISDNEIIVTVDTTVFDAVNNNIEIPLYTEIEGSGMSEVTISSINSPVTDGTYTFAHSSFPSMDIDIEASDIESAFDITFYDDYPYSMVSGRIFELTLDNGFVFTGDADIKGTGKYNNMVEFRVSDNAKTAYVRLTGNTTNATGVIELKNVVISPTANSVTGDINISIKAINGSGFSKTLHLGSYSNPADNQEQTEPSEDEATDNISEDTIKFIIGNEMYYVGTVPYKMDSKPYINGNGRTMIPLRAAANALGISDNDIRWIEDDSFRGVIINQNGKIIKIPSGENYVEVNGVKYNDDSSAEIVSGRIFLPVRSLSNALGIDDKNIKWDSQSGEVFINKI